MKELLEQYKVRADWSSIDSNLVYPMDAGTNYQFHGYIPEEDVKLFLNTIVNVLNIDTVERGLPTRINNKYAIPYIQVGEMHKVQTFFYYQHDYKTWLISLTEQVKEYMG